MVGKHHRLDGHEFEQTPGDSEGQGNLVCCSTWGHKESDTTERMNWTELNWKKSLSRQPGVRMMTSLEAQVPLLFATVPSKSPSNLKWLLQLQPSHSCSEQQRKGQGPKGTSPTWMGLFKEYFLPWREAGKRGFLAGHLVLHSNPEVLLLKKKGSWGGSWQSLIHPLTPCRGRKIDSHRPKSQLAVL